MNKTQGKQHRKITQEKHISTRHMNTTPVYNIGKQHMITPSKKKHRKTTQGKHIGTRIGKKHKKQTQENTIGKQHMKTTQENNIGKQHITTHRKTT